MELWYSKQGNWTACLFTIGYGFVHALMSGHGKNIFFGWIISSGRKLKKVAVAAALAMAVHVFAAIVLVYSIWLVFDGRISSQPAEFMMWSTKNGHKVKLHFS